MKIEMGKSKYGITFIIAAMFCIFVGSVRAEIVTIQLPTEYVDGRPIAGTLALTVWYGTAQGIYSVEEPVGSGFTPGGTVEYETLFGCESNYYVAATATDEFDGSTSGFSNEINYMPICTFQPKRPTIININR